MSADARERLPAWRALSRLFLDTELDARDFDAIAQDLRVTGLPAATLHDVLWREVFPVLEANLRSVAGTWDGWPDEWLLERLRPSAGPARIRGDRAVVDEIRRVWAEVARRLADPGDDRHDPG